MEVDPPAPAEPQPAEAESAGRIVLLKEIDRTMAGLSVRVLGKVKKVDVSMACEVVITHENKDLTISTRLLGPLQIRMGSLWMFIGELEQNLKLAARVGRCVDGLDVPLFCEALEKRRRFLKDTFGLDM